MEKDYTVTRQMLPTETQRLEIDKKIAAANYLYALGAEYFNQTVAALATDPEFLCLFAQFDAQRGNPMQTGGNNPYLLDVYNWLQTAQLMEPTIYAWIKEAVVEHNIECLDDRIQRGLTHRLYKVVLFSLADRCTGSSTCEFNDANYIEWTSCLFSESYNKENDSLLVAGHEITLKPLMEGDFDLCNVPDNYSLTCRIIRRTRGVQRQYLAEFTAFSSPKFFM